jgi:hypothetical protein
MAEPGRVCSRTAAGPAARDREVLGRSSLRGPIGALHRADDMTSVPGRHRRAPMVSQPAGKLRDVLERAALGKLRGCASPLASYRGENGADHLRVTAQRTCSPLARG